MSGMMLADSPKYSKKRNGGIAAQLSRLTGKQMCYVAFILLNVVWFAASLVSVLRKKHTQNQMLRQQQQQQQQQQGEGPPATSHAAVDNPKPVKPTTLSSSPASVLEMLKDSAKNESAMAPPPTPTIAPTETN
mmetsp:Transcript_49094/g.157260  ORF Transcript_49094/g.157260 Transcript_49094/m.157260 type:complete len:133 (-) Transcript_49094:586-984(-)